jgi:hypothetical protein
MYEPMDPLSLDSGLEVGVNIAHSPSAGVLLLLSCSGDKQQEQLIPPFSQSDAHNSRQGPVRPH